MRYIDKEGALIGVEGERPFIYRPGGKWEPYGHASWTFGTPINESEAHQLMKEIDAWGQERAKRGES